MIRSYALLSVLFVVAAFSQTVPDPVRPAMPDTLFLRFTQPSRDSFSIPSPRLKFAGSTQPTAHVFVNGTEAHVYPSGAFITVIPLAAGPNTVRVTTVGTKGDSLMRDFRIIRSEPPRPAPHDTLVIDENSLEPAQDLWLGAGDVIQVRFKGSPGWDGTFDIPGVESWIPMRELPATETNGMPGIYVGQYRIRPDNRAENVQIAYRLKRSFFSREKVYGKAKVNITPDRFPIVAEVTGKRPYLNAGLGSDRLGGAKLGFIQPGVQVAIVGRVGHQYRVRLSDDMEAWLPEDMAGSLPQDTPLPRSLAGSISAVGSDSSDVVSLSLTRRLPYTSEQWTDPNVIAVDVYGATSNTNWITHHKSATGIESVRWTQVSADRYRLLITLRHRYHWGYDIDYVGTSLRIRVRRPPVVAADSCLAGLTIAVDAGHGTDQGAVGATGAEERNANISMARHLQQLLTERGARVVLTRTENQGPTMPERLDTILGSGAQILVSIHCNSGGDNSDPLGVRGTSAYYRYIGFKPLADVVYTRMLETGLAQFGVIGSFNFSLNGPTQLPNVLVETAFLSHPEDEMLLLDDAFRATVAAKITAGLEDYVRMAAEVH